MARPRTSETALSASIRSALERLGYWVERIQSGQVQVGRRFVHCASSGTPDLLVIGLSDAQHTWLEVKTPGYVRSRPTGTDARRTVASGSRPSAACKRPSRP